MDRKPNLLNVALSSQFLAYNQFVFTEISKWRGANYWTEVVHSTLVSTLQPTFHIFATFKHNICSLMVDTVSNDTYHNKIWMIWHGENGVTLEMICNVQKSISGWTVLRSMNSHLCCGSHWGIMALRSPPDDNGSLPSARNLWLLDEFYKNDEGNDMASGCDITTHSTG